jgi:hypothetical protein
MKTTTTIKRAIAVMFGPFLIRRHLYCAVYAATVCLCCNCAAVAGILFGDSYLWTDPASSGQVRITVEAIDNFEGNFDRYEWKYTVDNLTFDPIPGTTNGFGGLHIVFALPTVPGINDQHGPTDWVFNQEHVGLDILPAPATPPSGIGWDATPAMLGLLPGTSSEFSFTTPDNVIVLVSHLQVAHTWQNGTPVNFFGGLLATPATPEPTTEVMLMLGMAVMLFRRDAVAS